MKHEIIAPEILDIIKKHRDGIFRRDIQDELKMRGHKVTLKQITYHVAKLANRLGDEAEKAPSDEKTGQILQRWTGEWIYRELAIWDQYDF